MSESSEPTPQNRREYTVELIIFGVIFIVFHIIGIYGLISCTAYHPCPVWAQYLYWESGIILNVVTDIFLIFVVLPVLMKRLREGRKQG